MHATFARDHEYKRLGTVSPLAGIDLVTGQVADGVADLLPIFAMNADYPRAPSMPGVGMSVGMSHQDRTSVSPPRCSHREQFVTLKAPFRLGVSRRALRTTLSVAVSRR